MLSFVPRVFDNPALTRSFWGAAVALLVWQAAIFLRLTRVSGGRSLRTELRPQHYLQATVQLVVFALLGLGTGGLSMTWPGCWWRN